MKILNDPSSYASAISAAWHKSVENTLEAARLCAQADKELSSAEKTQLLERLPFEAPTFSKLVKIGNDTRLCRDDIRPRLPASFSTLYEIALFSDAQLERAVDSGALHPGATRADIEEVRKTPPRPTRATLPLFDDAVSTKDDEVAPALKVERVCFAELLVPDDFPAEQSELLSEELTRVAELYGVELVRRLTPQERAEALYSKSLDAFADRWERVGRKLARRRIKKLKKDAQKRNREWGFAPDEIEIDSNQGFDRIEEVFAFVGLEDEFDSLRAEAERLAMAPEMPPELARQTDPPEAWLPKKKYELNNFADWNFEEEIENG